MPGSTYSTNLKVELMATGENSGTWGDITNTNLGTALEQAIVGYGNPDYASDANLTISITNSNAAQAARALVLNVTSSVSLTATRELVVPTIQKQYIVQNNTTGSQSITVKTSAGTGITVPNGRKAHLYVNGTDVIQMFDFVDINGGAIDGTPIGASSASTGAFTTLNASGATTLDGNVTLGNASGDNVTVTGTITSNLLFTDNTYDIGASGATRPRNLFLAGAATIGGNLSVGGTLTLTGGVNLNGNVTVGDSSSDTLTINSTITSNLIFTDNTYDIGASGATRPRNLFLAGSATIGGNQTLTGSLTVDSTTDSSSTTTGSIQTDGGLGVAKALYVGTTANIAGAVTLSGGTANGVAYLNGSKVLTTGSALTFDGTNLSSTGGATFQGGPIGYGGGEVGLGSTTANIQNGIYTVATGSPTLIFDHRGTSNAGLFVWRNGTGGANTLATLNSAGLGVGISPSYALDVKASGVFNVARFAGQLSSVSTYIYTDTAYWAFGDGATYTGQLYGGHTINKTLSMYTDSVERVTIGATGNVGINTSSANAKLEVSIAAATSGEIARFTSPSYDSVYIAAGSSATSCGIGTLSSSALNLFVNSSSKVLINNSGYMGINNSNPQAYLHTKSSGLGDAGGIRVENTGAGGSYFSIWPTATVNGEGANKLVFNGTIGNIFAIEGATGNIVLGPPSSAGASQRATFNNATGGIGLGWGDVNGNYINIFGAYSSGALVLAAGLQGNQSSDAYTSSYGGGSIYRNAIRLDTFNGTGIQFFTNGSSTVARGTAITPSECARFDTSGRLLIGLTTSKGGNPSLQVKRTDATTGASTYSLAWLQNSTGYEDGFVVRATDQLVSIGADYAGTNHGVGLAFLVNNSAGAFAATEAARITASGNFIVGDTSFASNFRAGVSGNANALILAGTGGDTLMVRSSQATSPSQSIASFWSDNVGGINYSSGTLRFNFTTNGGLANYQANDTNLSDRREKTNFAPAKSYLDTICAIPVQTFNYIDQSEDDPGLTLGVVAQDVQAVAPELVAETNWGTKDNPKMRLSIYQTDLQYALMKALQELKAEFDAYKASHP